MRYSTRIRTAFRDACVAATLIALTLGVGCDGLGGLPPAPDIGGTSNYVGADVCRGCHTAVHQAWSGSPHAQSFNVLKSAGAAGRSECLGCHTTGFGEGGFVSEITTPKFASVSCESCHGPGATHVGTRNPAHIIRRPLTTVCARCHQNPDQPNSEEWSMSRHAQALTTVMNSPGATDDCLLCHSFDYEAGVRRNVALAARGLPPEPLPSIQPGATLTPSEGVGCSACHSPHNSTTSPLLRSTPVATCTRCHQDANPFPAVGPHAPQENLLGAVGGLQYSASLQQPTQVLIGVRGIHGDLEELGGCVKCHGVRATVANPTPAMPNQTGHRFEIAFTNCGPCHSPADAETLLTTLQPNVSSRVATLRQQAAALQALPNLLQPDLLRLHAALQNLDFIERDGSLGAHNAIYTRAVLDATQALLNNIPSP